MDVISGMSDGGSQMDALPDVSTEEVGVLRDASHLTASTVSSRFALAAPAAPVDLLSDGPASGRTSFSSYVTAISDLSFTSESDSEVVSLSRRTSISSSILPPEIEEIGKMPPWCVSPVSRPLSISDNRHTHTTFQARKSQRQWQLELQSKVVHLEDLIKPGNLPLGRACVIIKDAIKILEDANKLILEDPANKGPQSGSIFLRIFRNDGLKEASSLLHNTGFKEVSLRLDNAIANLSWWSHLFKPTRNVSDPDNRIGRGNDQLLPPLANHDPNMFLISLQLAKVYHAAPGDKFHEMKILVSLSRSKVDERFTGVIFDFFLDILGSETDRQANGYPMVLFLKISHYEPNVYAYGHLYDSEILSNFYEILKGRSASSEVQSAVVSTVTKLATNWLDGFAKENFIPILVEHLTSFNECGRQLKKQESDTIVDIWIEKKPVEMESNYHIKALIVKALWTLAKGHPLNTRSIVGSKLLSTCFTKLLVFEDEPPENRRISVELLMEITNMCSDHADLKQFFSAVYSKDAKAICEKLRIIDSEGAQYDCSNVVPCLIALTCLGNAFQTTDYSYAVYFSEGWEILGTLIQILEKRYPGVVTKEAAMVLSHHIPLRRLLHGTEIQVPALVILCCITKCLVFAEPEAMDDVHTVLEWASEERYFIQDATINHMILEAKSNLTKFN